MAPPRKTPTSLPQAFTGRVTRSKQTLDRLTQDPLGPANQTGSTSQTRPIGAFATSMESASTAPTPTNYSSGSDYSTPLTSVVSTPAPASLKGPMSTLSISAPKSASGPKTAVPKDSLLALRKSKFSITINAKRKRDELSNDDGDYCSEDDPDAVLARKLQEEEFAKPIPTSKPSSSKVGSEFHALPKLGQKVASANMSSDAEYDAESQEDREADSSDEEEGYAHTRKRQKTAYKATRKATRKSVGRRLGKSINNGKGKGKATVSSSVAATSKIIGRSLRSSTSNGKDKAKAKASSSVAAEDGEESDIASSSESDTASGSEEDPSSDSEDGEDDDVALAGGPGDGRRAYQRYKSKKRQETDKARLQRLHPHLSTLWEDLEALPVVQAGKAAQPQSISRTLKPFQLEGLAWMVAMETETEWKGGLLGDEMGLGKTIQAVSLIMSDHPAKKPSLILVPPVALLQWTSEIESYTSGVLKTLVYHGTNSKSKNLKAKDLKTYDVVIMSYNSLESMYRKQEKGWPRKDGLYKEKSIIHATQFHRVILDEAHCIKTRTTMTAKACFALKMDYRWCLSGTPLQNRIGEFFSLIRFLQIRPFASYMCRECPCEMLDWNMDEDSRCVHCNHISMRHVSLFNQELLNPIQRHGNMGPGAEAFKRLRLLTSRIMLRRLKKDHTNAMQLPVKEIVVDRQFFGEEENDFANSIMSSGQRKFDTYVAQGVLLNNYANIFGLIMQMRQVANHPDLILKKNAEGGQNIMVCSICDEPAEEAIRSRCKHDFCRTCVKAYLESSDQPDCPRCHIPLAIDLEQPDMEQDEASVKKSSIINRIKMENWTSSTKIELLVHDLYRLRSKNASHKSIIFSQFTTMLQLIEWRLRRAGITTVMLDGSMSPAQRQASIRHFMDNVDVECFLVSLRAGGVALNLTEASRVFIVDPWWNPAAEWQSADRCHRIGQTRPCVITRLCIEDSVESRMVLLQEKKTSMINSTINSDDAAMESLTPKDLQFLFRGN